MNLTQKNEKVVTLPADDKFILGDTVVIISGSAKGQKGVLKKKNQNQNWASLHHRKL